MGLRFRRNSRSCQAALLGSLRVRCAVLERVLGRQERHHAIAWNVVAKVRDQMPQVVFFGFTDGAVGEKHVGALAGQPLHRVVGVDPRVHAFCRGQLGARRPKLRCKDRSTGMKSSKEIHQV